MQRNLAGLERWEAVESDLVDTRLTAPTAFDPFLVALAEAVTVDVETKIRAVGVDPAPIAARRSRLWP